MTSHIQHGMDHLAAFNVLLRVLRIDTEEQ